MQGMWGLLTRLWSPVGLVEWSCESVLCGVFAGARVATVCVVFAAGRGEVDGPKYFPVRRVAWLVSELLQNVPRDLPRCVVRI